MGTNDYRDHARHARTTFRRNRLRLAAIRPEHAPDLVKLVESCSAESRFLRFHTGMHTLRPCMAQRLADTVDTDTTALGLWSRRGLLVADARYSLIADGVGETAILVSDRYQRRGLGSALLATLFQRAADGGVLALHAEVLPGNKGILATLDGLVPVEHVGHQDGLGHICLTLTDEPCPLHGLAEAA